MINNIQSSCKCNNCKKNTYDYNQKNGFQTNMSVINCNFPKLYECFDEKIFLNQVEPQNNNGYKLLNPQVIEDKLEQNECLSTDPRLISAFHSGQRLELDRNPIVGSVKEKDINTDLSLNSYGKKYNTYSDINAGQILYYENNSRKNAFHYPNFTISSNTIGTLYKDPMGSIKPQYNRYPLENKNSNLSWINDSTNHREDLMSKQMLKRNQQRWMPRWQ